MHDLFLSEKVRDEAIIKVKTEQGRTAADIGAGEGFMTEGLLNAGLNVIIADPSPEMLKILNERFGHFREVQIVRMSNDTISIPDNSVDYAFANMCMIQSGDPLLLIKEMHRILKPGGKLAITDLTEFKDENYQKKLKFCHPGFNMPDLYEWFVIAGIKEISIEVLSQKCSYKDDEGNSFTFGYFLAYGEKQ